MAMSSEISFDDHTVIGNSVLIKLNLFADEQMRSLGPEKLSDEVQTLIVAFLQGAFITGCGDDTVRLTDLLVEMVIAQSSFVSHLKYSLGLSNEKVAEEIHTITVALLNHDEGCIIYSFIEAGAAQAKAWRSGSASYNKCRLGEMIVEFRKSQLN